MKEYYITIDGSQVPVTEEVYRAYMQPVWREAKQAAVRAQHEFSLDAVQYEGADFAAPGMSVCDAVERELLRDLLDELAADERELIYALYFEGLSERDVARRTGVARKTFAYRKTKTLEQLKKIIEKNL